MLKILALGLPVMLMCLTIQAALTGLSVRHFLRNYAPNAPEHTPWFGIRLLMAVMVILMLGNVLQISIWGALFLWLGEFTELYEAVYHSAVNFTSLGYGDVVMSKSWKLLGPLEAANGVLMCGMSAGALMAVMQALIKDELRKRKLLE